MNKIGKHIILIVILCPLYFYSSGQSFNIYSIYQYGDELSKDLYKKVHKAEWHKQEAKLAREDIREINREIKNLEQESSVNDKKVQSKKKKVNKLYQLDYDHIQKSNGLYYEVYREKLDTFKHQYRYDQKNQVALNAMERQGDKLYTEGKEIRLSVETPTDTEELIKILEKANKKEKAGLDLLASALEGYYNYELALKQKNPKDSNTGNNSPSEIEDVEIDAEPEIVYAPLPAENQVITGDNQEISYMSEEPEMDQTDMGRIDPVAVENIASETNETGFGNDSYADQEYERLMKIEQAKKIQSKDETMQEETLGFGDDGYADYEYQRLTGTLEIEEKDTQSADNNSPTTSNESVPKNQIDSNTNSQKYLDDNSKIVQQNGEASNGQLVVLKPDESENEEFAEPVSDRKDSRQMNKTTSNKGSSNGNRSSGNSSVNISTTVPVPAAVTPTPVIPVSAPVMRDENRFATSESNKEEHPATQYLQQQTGANDQATTFESGGAETKNTFVPAENKTNPGVENVPLREENNALTNEFEEDKSEEEIPSQLSKKHQNSITEENSIENEEQANKEDIYQEELQNDLHITESGVKPGKKKNGKSNLGTDSNIPVVTFVPPPMAIVPVGVPEKGNTSVNTNKNAEIAENTQPNSVNKITRTESDVTYSSGINLGNEISSQEELTNNENVNNTESAGTQSKTEDGSSKNDKNPGQYPENIAEFSTAYNTPKEKQDLAEKQETTDLTFYHESESAETTLGFQSLEEKRENNPELVTTTKTRTNQEGEKESKEVKKKKIKKNNKKKGNNDNTLSVPVIAPVVPPPVVVVAPGVSAPSKNISSSNKSKAQNSSEDISENTNSDLAYYSINEPGNDNAKTADNAEQKLEYTARSTEIQQQAQSNESSVPDNDLMYYSYNGKSTYDKDNFSENSEKEMQNNEPIRMVSAEKFGSLSIVFRVQVAADLVGLNEREIRSKYKGNRDVTEFREDGWYKYSVGDFTNYKEAKQIKDNTRVDDAFVVAYVNGVKTSVWEARRMLKNQPPQLRVQVAASRVQLSESELRQRYQGSQPVKMIYEDGWYKYSVSGGKNLNQAIQIKKDTHVPDAFIVAYQGSRKISLKEMISSGK